MRKLFVLMSLILTFNLTAQAAPAWHSWYGVTPFPAADSIDYGAVRDLHFEVFDINAVEPSKCAPYCFRVNVYVNGELFAVVPTSPGSTRHSWGGRTPIFTNAGLARGGYKGYRLHGKNYLSGKKPGRSRSNLRYFMVFKLTSGKYAGQDRGIGFHGDKNGKFKVTGQPESHACMRVTDSNAYIMNRLARAVIDNTGSAKSITLTTNHTKRRRF